MENKNGNIDIFNNSIVVAVKNHRWSKYSLVLHLYDIKTLWSDCLELVVCLYSTDCVRWSNAINHYCSSDIYSLS